MAKKKKERAPKLDWKIYHWVLPNGNKARGICPTTEDPWDYFGIDRTITMEHRAVIHSATEEKAREVMEVLLV